MLRLVLARLTGIAPAELRFEVSPGGRPELASLLSSGAPRFNLSHTRGLVGCAVARGREVGLDVEELRAPAPLELAERHFAAAELEALRALPPPRRSDRFYALWTLKEAYSKGRGLGLSLPFDAFSIAVLEGEEARLCTSPPGSPASGWYLRHWVHGRHRVALAVSGCSSAIVLRVVTDVRLRALARGVDAWSDTKFRLPRHP